MMMMMMILTIIINIIILIINIHSDMNTVEFLFIYSFF